MWKWLLRLFGMDKKLTGDGNWSFTAEIDGDDIVVKDILIMVCGGGGGGRINDPQDTGDTASGVNTKEEEVWGVAVPMDGRMFARLRPEEHRDLDGSPIPRVPFHLPVQVT